MGARSDASHDLYPELCLALWERGRTLHPLDGALLALASCRGEQSGASPADWPFGRRNRALLQLHAACFGPRLEAWAACPRCGEMMEMALEIEALLTADAAGTAETPVEVNGRSYRLPSSRDLAAMAGVQGPAGLRLAERCRIAGEPTEPADLPRIATCLAEADPLAEIPVALECPVCDAAWEEPLDVWAFVWAAVEPRGRGLLREVHRLARSYGWSERAILTLGEARRRSYLELIEEEGAR